MKVSLAVLLAKMCSQIMTLSNTIKCKPLHLIGLRGIAYATRIISISTEKLNKKDQTWPLK
jgi:hypothetical protein